MAVDEVGKKGWWWLVKMWRCMAEPSKKKQGKNQGKIKRKNEEKSEKERGGHYKSL